MRTRWLYFRLFGFTAAIATGAYWVQLPGLNAIWPLAQNLSDFINAPTLLLVDASPRMLHALCALCFVSSLLVLFDVAVPFALGALFVGWCSLVNAGDPFTGFQWDMMLCEAALLSIPYALHPKEEPQLWQRLLPALVAVKVTLESGIVKLTAGDSSWWPDLTALTYHYWTQPLPAWTSVFIDRAPLRVHQAACVAMFALELGVPLLAFGPRRARHVAAAGMIALQLGLAVAGNYAYFNLLCMVLCVPLLGEAPSQRWRPVIGWSAFGAAALFSALVFGQQFRPPYPAPLKAALLRLQTFNVLHSYGVFRVMTKERPEIIFEGSTDGVTWKTYELKWKPGRVDRRPEFVAPWQPRLDWQLWFAAMGHCERWVQSLLGQLLLGTPEVLALFEQDPFGGARPRYLRTTLYQYRFAPSGSGDWWTRTEEGPYCPPVMLDEQGRLVRAQ